MYLHDSKILLTYSETTSCSLVALVTLTGQYFERLNVACLNDLGRKDEQKNPSHAAVLLNTSVEVSHLVFPSPPILSDFPSIFFLCLHYLQ